LSEAEQGWKVWEYFDIVEKVWDGNLDDSSAVEDAENEDNATDQPDEDAEQEAEVLERYKGGSRIQVWRIEENEANGQFWAVRKVPFPTSSGQRR
jgi:hypothetical protein